MSPASRMRPSCCVPRTESTSSLHSSSAEGGANLDAKELRAHLKDCLPPYMLPQRYEFTDTLPKLAVRQSQSQPFEKNTPHRRHGCRRAGGAAHRNRSGIACCCKARAAAAIDSVRCGLLHRTRRPLAARGALRLRRARDAAPAFDYAAGRLCRANAARHSEPARWQSRFRGADARPRVRAAAA